MKALTVFACLSLLLLGVVAEEWGEEELFVDENDLTGDEEEAEDLLADENLSMVDGETGESEWLKEDAKIFVDDIQTENEDEKDQKACPKDFVYNADLEFCFKVIDGKPGNLKTGMKLCSDLVKDGRLVELDTKEKTEAVEKVINKRGRVPNSGYFLGAKSRRSHVYSFRWLNGGKMKYQNWCIMSPNSRKTCLRLVKQHGHLCWDDDCCFRPKYFICEKPIV